jgi:hypothetical protein
MLRAGLRWFTERPKSRAFVVCQSLKIDYLMPPQNQLMQHLGFAAAGVSAENPQCVSHIKRCQDPAPERFVAAVDGHHLHASFAQQPSQRSTTQPTAGTMDDQSTIGCHVPGSVNVALQLRCSLLPSPFNRGFAARLYVQGPNGGALLVG